MTLPSDNYKEAIATVKAIFKSKDYDSRPKYQALTVE
jgi:hypothetical protein